mmetsp:Transcript_25869/g.73599  ORF Transcript_25869/g.73599 Transcript_25869/m.73599 type:complete len:207 (-) Transcript_25869:102-722(-)
MLESRATVLYMCHGRRRRRVAPIRVYRHPAEAGGEVLGHAGHGPAVRKPHPHNAPRQLLRGHPRLGHEYVDPALLLSAAEDQLHGGVVHRALEGAAHAHPHTAALVEGALRLEGHGVVGPRMRPPPGVEEKEGGLRDVASVQGPDVEADRLGGPMEHVGVGAHPPLGLEILLEGLEKRLLPVAGDDAFRRLVETTANDARREQRSE